MDNDRAPSSGQSATLGSDVGRFISGITTGVNAV